MDKRLLKAALRGNVDLLHQLLQQKPNILDGNVLDGTKGNHLHVQMAAAQGGHLGYNQEILIAEPEFLIPNFISKENPLHIAAQFGHVHFMREILNRKPHFARELNWEGQSPLHLASAKGHLEVVKMLSENYPDACLDRDFKGRTPLHLAAMKGQVKLLEVLLNAEHDAAYVLTKEGEPILHLCANHNQFKSLEKLLELLELMMKDDEFHDEFLNLRDADNNTILHLVATKGNGKLIRLLAGKGVDINAENVYGSRAFDVLVENTSGLDGWWTKLFLVCAGAEIKRKWLSTRPENPKPKTVTENYNNLLNEGLLVLAILMATVAFQAGINPPGGLWQETGYHNETTFSRDATIISQKLVPHVAGESIFSYTHKHTYYWFCVYNCFTLLLSLVLLGLLVVGFNLDTWWSPLTVAVVTFGSVFSMVKAYQKAMVVLSPPDVLKGLWVGIVFIGWNRNGAVTVILISTFLIFAVQVIPINFWYFWYHFIKCTSLCPKFKKKNVNVVLGS